MTIQASTLPFIIITQQSCKVVAYFQNRKLDVLQKTDCPKKSEKSIQAIFHVLKGCNFIKNILFLIFFHKVYLYLKDATMLVTYIFPGPSERLLLKTNEKTK